MAAKIDVVFVGMPGEPGPKGIKPWLPGRYYGPSETVQGSRSLGSAAVVALRHYAVPMTIPSGVTLDRIGVTVMAAVGTFVHMAIYSVGANGLPNLRLVDGGNVAMAAGGIESTIAFAGGPADVWLIVACDGAATLRTNNPGAALLGAAGVGDILPAAEVYADRASLVMPTSFGTPSGYSPYVQRLIRVRAA